METRIKTISETHFFTILDEIIINKTNLLNEEKYQISQETKEQVFQKQSSTSKIPKLLTFYEHQIYLFSLRKSEISIYNMNLERLFNLTMKSFKDKKDILKNIENVEDKLEKKLNLYNDKLGEKRSELEMNEIFYNYLVRRYIEDLAILFLRKDEVYEKFKKINLEEIFIDAEKQKIVNFFIPRVMMFIVFAAKFIQLFLFPNYHFLGDKSYLTIFLKKLTNYPLFFDKYYGLNPPKMALKYLHSDFVKILKHLGISLDVNSCLFNDLSDICNLIEIFYDKYLN